jgi:hypothetical protein
MQRAGRRQRHAGSTVLRRTVLAALAMLAVSYGIWVAIRPDDPGDLPVYEEYASILLAGNVPYRDFFMEYPPGALPVFVAPAFIFGDARDAAWTPADDAGRRYRRAFDSLVLLLTAAMVVLTALSLAALRRPPRAQVLPLAVVAASPLLIGSVFSTRYDIWPAALTASALAAAVRGRYRLAGAAVGLAAAAKIYPLILLPVLLIGAVRRRGAREAIAVAASALGAAAAIFLPFFLASSSATWADLRLQFGGGLHAETLAGTVLVLTNHVAEALTTLGLPPPADLTIRPETRGIGRAVLAGAGVDATATAMTLLLAVALCLLWIAAARESSDPNENLVRYSAASVAVALVLGTVLSAQYVTWLIPLVPLVAGRRGLAATVCLVTAALLTNGLFPSDVYGRYAGQDLGASSLLFARNLALLGIAAALIAPARWFPWARAEASPDV